MIKFKRFGYIAWPYLIFILVSIVWLPLSILYKYTSFVDINTMIAMGRSVIHGLVPFKDLFEQRGPYMYLLHTVSALPGPAIHWLWLLELINFFGLYCIFYKTSRLIISVKNSRWIALLGLFVLMLSTTINCGASPEEFMILPTAYVFYLVLRMVQQKTYQISHKEIFVLGLALAWATLIKYSGIGAICVFFIIYGLDLLRQKKIIEFAKTVGLSVSGLIVGFIPALIYFGYHHSIGIFFKSYFGANSGLANRSFINLFGHYITALVTIIFGLSVIICIIGYPILISYSTYSKRSRIYIFGTMFGSIAMTSLIMRWGSSYGLLLVVLLIMLAIHQTKNVQKSIQMLPNVIRIVLFVTLAGLALMPLTFSLNTHRQYAMGYRISSIKQALEHNRTRDDFSYKQGSFIKNHGGGNLLTYEIIPNSIYEDASTYPKLKYFDQTTIPYIAQPESADSQFEYMQHGDADWVQMTAMQYDKHLTKSIYQSYIRESNRIKNKTLAGITSANVTATRERITAHPNDYQKIVIKTPAGDEILLYMPNKALSNYDFVMITTDESPNSVQSVKYGQYFKGAYLLLAKKNILEKQHLKPLQYQIVK